METMTLQGFRLSPQQRRAWLVQQDSALCGSQALVRLDGALDVRALSDALAGVIRENEILRTAFRRVPGLKVPVQVVEEAMAPAVERLDLELHGEVERNREIESWIEHDRRRPFDLDGGAPLRVALFRLAEQSHLLLLTLPPVCADSATLEALVREIARLYAGLEGAAPAGSMQYADFAEWQNDFLSSEEAEEGKDSWRRMDLSALSGIRLVNEGEAVSPIFDCETVGLNLAADEVRAARELARRSEVSLRAVLLASWQALLARLTGRSETSEMVVGVVSDGRSYAEIESSLGPFARTLPVSCAVGGLAFREVVRRVENALGEAEAWQDYFVADELLAAGAAGEAPPSLPFAFELTERMEEIAASGLRFALERRFHCAERFKLRLVCDLAEEEGRAELQVDPQRFHREEAVRLAGQWRRLLAALLADPERQAEDVDLLDEEERRLLLEEWNRTDAPFPADLGIHQLVEAQAQARPEAVALLSGGRTMTYGELDGRADRLARSLVDLGVRPGSRVGLVSDRSFETVAGLLAVLKAGGAYVALDPEQPRARLAHVLEQTAPVALLVPKALAASLPETAAAVVFLDEEPAPSAAPLPAADSERLAYVVFTSGSSGRPKGVLIPHRGVVNYLTFLRTAYGLGESDVVLQIPDLTFDSAVRDLLGPLAAGARVVLVERELAKDPRTLVRKVREHGVTCLLSAVPTMLRALLDAAAHEPVPGGQVRLVLASGEVLRAADGARVERVFGGGARLFNQYGPTECTMTSSLHPVPSGLGEDDATALPIGRPIPNARFYLLDGRRLPVPAGTPGELYIGGAGVASGYLNAPELTAERFVEDPFAASPGARLYRTGDLAVYRPDGVLEFRGRIDQQVKVRGLRIEPEEIEAALLEHPQVRRAVVLARGVAGDLSGDLRLVAYVVLDGQLAGEELRVFLRGRLPEAMIPSAFVVLDALPTTPNGKVDRRTLATIDPVESEREAPSRTALTPTEEIVAGIWADVLKAGEVDPREDFFSLGGHSILGTQVILRINAAFQVAIPLRTLFDVPTVEGLARVVDEAMLSAQGLVAPPLRPVPRGEAMPLSFAQQRLWFLDQLHPGNPLFNLGSAVRLTGPLDRAVLGRTLDEIVRRHEVLRTTFAGTGQGPVQIVAPAAPVPLPVIDLSDREPAGRETETARLVSLELRRPFDLSRGPLLRALVVRQSAEEHVLFLGVHHIVSDAWSSGVLFRELATIFEAFSRGAAPRLAELPVQYADFAAWQRSWMQGEVLESHLDFWKRQLAGAPPSLDLPFDRPRPAQAAFRGERHVLELPEDLAAELSAVGRREGATLFMILLAALDGTLSFLGAGDDLVVGTDVANRTRAEVEELIGFFINQLVLRTDLSGDPTFRELLARVRKTAMDAYAHQDLPFDKLVEVLRPERSLNQAALFQVKLVLQNTPRAAVELPSGLTVERMALEGSSAREDLLLNAIESEGRLTLSFKYNAGLFDAATIVRMAGLFETFLRRAAADPVIPLSGLRAALAEADRELRASQAQEHASALEQKLKTIRRRATSR